MKNKHAFYTFLILVLAGILGGMACEGPAGPRGMQGEQGPEGPQGPQGDEGTANVIYSEWLEVEWNGADEDNFKRMDIIEPMITEEFMSTGTALMYLESSGAVFALPFATATGQSFTFFMRPEGFSASLPGTFPEDPGLSFYIQREGGVASGGLDGIRYVLIPEGVPAKIPAGIWKNYENMMEFLGIPE